MLVEAHKLWGFDDFRLSHFHLNLEIVIASSGLPSEALSAGYWRL
jgi:hypothetical protein